MLNYFPENQPYRKIQPSITPEIKLVRTYSDDIFLQKRYQKRKIFLGPISMVLEMAGKTLVLSRIGSMESMPEQIDIEFKNPTRDGDRSYTRTMLEGVKDNHYQGYWNGVRAKGFCGIALLQRYVSHNNKIFDTRPQLRISKTLAFTMTSPPVGLANSSPQLLQTIRVAALL